jgi:hypothetical protein
MFLKATTTMVTMKKKGVMEKGLGPAVPYTSLAIKSCSCSAMRASASCSP